MHFNTAIFSASILLTSLIPQALSAPTTSFRTRDIGPGNSNCSGVGNHIDPSAASDYAIFIDGTNQVDAGLGTKPEDCGHGFLDNLHGQCGLGIINWTCNIQDGGYAIGFTSPITCQGSSIQNAIWLATNPHMDGVICQWYSPDDGESIIDEILESLDEDGD
jgi:hypothetical protein